MLPSSSVAAFNIPSTPRLHGLTVAAPAATAAGMISAPATTTVTTPLLLWQCLDMLLLLFLQQSRLASTTISESSLRILAINVTDTSSSSSSSSSSAFQSTRSDTVNVCQPQRFHASILKPLATTYAALIKHLSVIKMAKNSYDEGADLGAFVRTARQLSELTFYGCGGLTTVRTRRLSPLSTHAAAGVSLNDSDNDENEADMDEGNRFEEEGCCDERNITNLVCAGQSLTTIDVSCCRRFVTLNGLLHDFPMLEVLRAEGSSISSLAGMCVIVGGSSSFSGGNQDLVRGSSCLRIVDLSYCADLDSLEGIQFFTHPLLKEINLSGTAIASVGLLSSSPSSFLPALVKLNISNIQSLTSLDGLQGHPLLEELDASHNIAITSIAPLRTCPGLRNVDVSYCHQLASLDGLQTHEFLQVVNVTGTAISSVEALRSCPALVWVGCSWCPGLTALDGLEGHAMLEEVDMSNTPILSICSTHPSCRYVQHTNSISGAVVSGVSYV